MEPYDRRNDEQPEAESDNPWLKKATEAYQTSTNYLEQNIWRQWQKNLCHFHNRHDSATKYANKDYIGRSKTFRPKTRSSIRATEATLAAALFSTSDLISVTAGRQGDQQQQASADIAKEILQYRLEKRVPWFLTSMGAYQDTHNYGVCVSKQYWDYDQHTEKTEDPLVYQGQEVVDENGQMVTETNETTIVDVDELRIDLLAPENFRFSPMADWREPVSDSPYLIELIPMYACDVLTRMQQLDDKTGQPRWKQYSLEEILTTDSKEGNQVRLAREGFKRKDPVTVEHREYSTLWIHHNIIRDDRGQDYFFLTLGTQLMLTDPVPVEQVYPHGRPYIVGMSVLEAHKSYPAGINEIAGPLQQEINSIANQRQDNVSLVLNKRYFIRRGTEVDLKSLQRNIPGSGVLMSDPQTDVHVVNTPDVTASSYQEHDRLAIELDEVVGNFSQASVQSNRNLNETVGGMEMMNAGANAVQEYTIRTFIETWVAPVLRQCIKLIQSYETDATIMALSAEKAELWQKYGIDPATDALLNNDLTLTVNVGMGNTNPTQRVDKLMMGLNTTSNIPGVVERVDSDEVIKEVFGALGYQDGSRFFKSPEQLQQEQQGQEPPPDPKMMEIQMRQQIAQQEAQLKQQQLQQDMQIAQARLQNEREMAMMRLALDKDLKLSEMQNRLGLQQQQFDQKERQIQTTRDVAALREKNKMIDIDWKNKFADLKYRDNANHQAPSYE